MKAYFTYTVALHQTGSYDNCPIKPEQTANTWSIILIEPLLNLKEILSICA